MKSILLTILSSVSCALVALAEDASATAAPKPIAASTDLLSFMRLEGMNNLGEAAVEKKDRAVEVKGALVTPFPLGSSQSQASAQVRLYIPKRDGTPYHGSACLGFYGKNRNHRLFAFVCFNLPGMAPGQCEVGFLARASKQIPLAFEAWHTMKLETADGLARMKIWADGTAEPDWMIDASVESSLEDIDGAGVRTCGQPVLFESFSASGTQYKEAILTVGSEGEGIVGKLRNDGSLRDLKVRYADGWQTVEFRQDQFRGPGFGRSIRLERDPCETISFSGKNDDVRYRLAYAIADRQLQVTATVINSGKKPFAPERLPLVLGIDSFMDSYPRWNSLCFPTLIRREPSHLWGYMMTPHGRIFGIASPDPVGSYTIEYLRQMYAHHIYTISLDLLQKPPVPGHHPTYAPLAPSKQRTWTVNLIPVETLDAVKSKLAASARAPMLDLYRYSLEPGQPAEMSVFSFSPVTAIVVTPAGTEVPCPVGKKEGNLHQATFPDTAEYGDYRVRIQDGAGKTSTGGFFVRPPWSWYLKQARLEALRLTPRADRSDIDGFSCESYYGLLGFYLAAKHFRDPAIDIKGDRLLEKVLERLFREKDGKRFSGNPERITNGEFMISLLVVRYAATGDLKSLEMANEFAEYLLSRQHKDGYYGGHGMANYNAVLYPTKAIMELMAAEKPLAADSPKWQQRYERHARSIKRAIDHMVAQGRDVKTEGAGTFEDGAVSCTAAQIAMFALLQEDAEQRRKYTAAARQFLADHACLTRLLDTDARSIGGTARWWEAWNDEKRSAQMMTSPHGWSGWRLYAVYYLYLLTGEEEYLRGLMNAMGSCTQLLEWPSGRLRQAFVIDPHVHNVERFPDPANPRWGRAVETVTCEDYIGTIGEWWSQTKKGDGYLDRAEWGWTGDGIPYEIFKAMEEIAVTQAFVIERADGAIIGYNCNVSLKDNSVEVIPAEAVAKRVHVNLKTPRQVRVSFANGNVSAKCPAGMQWLATPKP